MQLIDIHKDSREWQKDQQGKGKSVVKKTADPKKKGGKADLPPPEPEPELVEEEVEEVNPIDLMKTLREELRLKEAQGSNHYYYCFWIMQYFQAIFAWTTTIQKFL